MSIVQNSPITDNNKEIHQTTTNRGWLIYGGTRRQDILTQQNVRCSPFIIWFNDSPVSHI